MLFKLMDKNKKNIYAVLVSIAYSIFINICKIDDLVFYETVLRTKYIIKILHIIFLFVIIRTVIEMVNNRATPEGEKWITYSLLYMIVTGVMYVFIYPGFWSWDDVFVYTSACNYDLNPWQHFLTSLYHMLCLQTIPCAGGVIIVQIVLISMICGKIISILANYHSKSIYTIISFVGFCLPPVIVYEFSGFRMGIYTFLELLFGVCVINELKRDDNIPIERLVNYAILAIIVSSWRSEGIIYIAFFVFFLVLAKKRLLICYKVACFICVMLAVLYIGYYNNKLIDNNNYSLTATIVPIKEIIVNATLSEEEEKSIENVIDIDLVRNNAGYKAEELFYMGMVKSDYSIMDYKEYMNTYIRLLLRHPFYSIGGMFDIWSQTAGLNITNGYTAQRTPLINTSGGALSLFDNEGAHSKSWLTMKAPFKHPINLQVRNVTMLWLSCLNSYGQVKASYLLLWNLWIPLALLVMKLVQSIYKKDYLLCALVLTIFIKSCMVFMTACAPYIMYYLVLYISGWIFPFVSFKLNDTVKRQFLI